MSRHLVDPALLPLLDSRPQQTLAADTVLAYRQAVLDLVALRPTPDPTLLDSVRREEKMVAGLPGTPDVPVLVYAPVARGDAPLPAFLHIHGGGFVAGSADMSDPNSRALARDMDCVVVSVDYRLAPETRFPGAVEDCHAALVWLHDEAAALGVDTARIAIGGESGGGGLAAALALLARDRGQVQPCFQYLIAPMLDPRSADSDHPHVGAFNWTRAHNRYGWQALIGDGGGSISPYAAPAHAPDLTGSPPAYIHVGALDLFLEENIEHARRLTRAGVTVELHVWPGAYHGFEMVDAPIAHAARATARAALRRALHP